MPLSLHQEMKQQIDHTIKNARELDQIEVLARPGRRIALEGRYETDITWRTSGAASKRIVIDCAGARFQDLEFTIDADFVTLYGGEFKNCQITLLGHACRVTQTHHFEGEEGGNKDQLNCAIWLTKGASECRVDHNLIEGWQRNAIRHTGMTKGGLDNLIDHNLIRDLTRKKFKNGNEALQIGSGRKEPRLGNINTHVVFNRFEDFTAEPEIISLKANGNYVGHNTFLDCPRSTITCRSGSRNVIESNLMINCRGIIIYGDDNALLTNTVKHSKICEIGIRSGDAKAKQIIQGKFPGAHPAAQRTDVVENVVEGQGIIIGEPGTGKIEYYDKQHFPALDTMLMRNHAKIVDAKRKLLSKGTRHVTEDPKGLQLHTKILAPVNESDVGIVPDTMTLDYMSSYAAHHMNMPAPKNGRKGPKPKDPADRMDALEARVLDLEETLEQIGDLLD